MKAFTVDGAKAAARLAEAARDLGGLWLGEVREADLERLRGLPVIGDSLRSADAAQDRAVDGSGTAVGQPDDSALIDDLAVEYQRLFGFNLPPYESIFVDPSARMQAPATQRVQARYRALGWAPPAEARIAATDQLGALLLAWAAALEAGESEIAALLVQEHLGLWLPTFVEALQQLRPHPFYDSLGALTLGLVMSAQGERESGYDPFPDLPDLPEPPRRRLDETKSVAPIVEAVVAAAQRSLAPAASVDRSERRSDGDEAEGASGPGLRELVRHLSRPRSAGLYLGRQDLADIARACGLPHQSGERQRMLESLLRSAGEHDLVPAVTAALAARLDEAAASYQSWEACWPAWAPIGAAWRRRLEETRALLAPAWEDDAEDDAARDSKLLESSPRSTG
jgi:TorA maturation chaperone TorD